MLDQATIDAVRGSVILPPPVWLADDAESLRRWRLASLLASAIDTKFRDPVDPPRRMMIRDFALQLFNDPGLETDSPEELDQLLAECAESDLFVLDSS